MTRRMVSGVALGVAALMLIVSCNAQAQITQGVGQNFVAFEAEAGRITHNVLPPASVRPWALTGGGTASGGQYLESHGPAGSGGVAGGEWTSTYNIVFNAPGTYNIYAKVAATSGSNDSFFVPNALGGAPGFNNFATGTQPQFTWQQNFSINVGGGQVGTPQQFTIAVREGDGFQLDRMVLSTTGGLNAGQLNALANSHASAPKFLNPLNGQYYEMGPGGTFAQGKAAAEALSFLGVQGRLAIIESGQENRFLTGLLGPPIPNDVDGGWIGLTDNEGFGGSEAGNNQINGWVWTTPGGPISLASTGFQRWNAGEPNDFGAGEDAGQLTDVNINVNGGVWNDLPLTGTQASSFVEYTNEPQTATANMRVAYGSMTIDSLQDAKDLLNGANLLREASAEIYAVNFQGPQGGGALNPWDEGRYLGNVGFPGESSGGDNNFAALISGFIEIPSAGPWTFGTNSDDGVELVIDGNTLISFDPGSTFPADSFGVFNAPDEGLYEFTLIYYENAGGAGLELFAAEGIFSQFDPTAFRLVGDFPQGGLRFAVAVPEPTSIAVWSLIGIGLACWGWRKRRKT